MSGVIARILGKQRSSEQLASEREIARVAMNEAKLKWGREGGSAKVAFHDARDRFDELDAQLLAAKEREAALALKEAEALTARREAELAATMLRIASIESFAEREAAVSVEEHERICKRLKAIEARLQERIDDTKRANELAALLGKTVDVRDYTRENVLNLCKHEIEKASHARNEERRISEDAAELVSARWLT